MAGSIPQIHGSQHERNNVWQTASCGTRRNAQCFFGLSSDLIHNRLGDKGVSFDRKLNRSLQQITVQRVFAARHVEHLRHSGEDETRRRKGSRHLGGDETR